jgi:integrase
VTRTLAAVAGPAEQPSSWERLLLGAVRPQFRGEVIVVAEGSPLLGAGCAVAGCTCYSSYWPWGRGTGRALCALHGQEWKRQGRPEIDGWLACAKSLQGVREVRACEVPGCSRSSLSGGRCRTHLHRESRPCAPAGDSCRVEHCEFPVEPGRMLCDAHQSRYRVRAHRSPLSVDAFVAWSARKHERARGAYVVRAASGVLRLELQYLLQREADAGRALCPRRFNDIVIVVAAERVGSVLSREPDAWRHVADNVAGKGSERPGALIAYMHERLCELRDQTADPWAPDRWSVSRLPLGGDYEHDSAKTINFATIGRGWLRELLKRWARYRLQTGTSGPSGICRTLWAFREFERFCELHAIKLTRAEDLSRGMLEDFLDHVAKLPLARNSKNALLRNVKVVLDDIDRHGWAGLQRDARYFRDELPGQSESVPRFIDETVMGQLETDQALARLEDVTTITAVIVLIETGLRSQDALLLVADPVVVLPDGSPVLRFVNHKRKREAAIPISDRLLARIRFQQQRNAHAFPNGSPWLLPAIGQGNGQGQRPFNYTTLLSRMTGWLARLELVDQHGAPVRVTPHQFRHTLGTRMINEDIPLEVIRRMLDHGSLSMTQVYARLSDAKLREHFDTFTERINRRGENVTLHADGVLGEATWTKERLARARQALPNGYCGLPLQQRCPHPNACLSCDSFLTDTTFLGPHREHLARVEAQLDQARSSGWERIVESNESDRINLINIIEGLERLEAEKARHDRAA